jgi:hypothetical protein
MASQRTSFGKLQRDRDKKAKAAAKRSRRQEGADAAPEDDAAEGAPATTDGGRQPSTADLLEKIAELHQQFEAGVISYEHFEETKTDLMSRLSVD